ncbi:MAG TPA: SAM-dependent methyltransferase [Cytophagales bacterium]|jgi:hypothetical protein|nr:SAM-dependent methyltransferase [Cytophagales bacterium]
MALSWNEIKDRAIKFSKEWADTTNEEADAKPFLVDFFNVFGIIQKKVASFEHRVKKLDEHDGYIDMLWKGTLLVEMKSKGKNLDKAYQQARDYLHGLKQHELPKYILICDFDIFRLYDLEADILTEFHLSELVNNVQHFGFIAGYQKREFKEQDPVNIKAAELMGKLHDKLKAVGYEGHPLEAYLVRLLFILFADDTTIFDKDIFIDFIEQKTSEDGSDLASRLTELFYILNTSKEKRLKNIDEHLNRFPYVNGKLFEEQLPPASFDTEMRNILIECCYLDWGKISPAIFGSMFQSVMNPVERRNLGAHYTSEKNILKLIKPLFLDELWAEFESAKGNKNKLVEFHSKLSKLKFLDPACGCGNFLIITYRELRLLEIEILRELNKSRQRFLDVGEIIWLDVDMMYGIEYEEFPARIAEVAMWLIDHQMNMLISQEFGQYFARLPLKKAAIIINGNSLRIKWEDLVSPNDLSYILGNPPFYGSKNQTEEQKEDISLVFNNLKGIGVLDYVTAWYKKSAEYIKNTNIEVAFVSTNSITQGEQVAVLWSDLLFKHKIKINFAHRTFKWQNEAKGNAAVHVVIIGFSTFDKKIKKLYEYESVQGESHEVIVKNINPYLVEAKDILISSSNKPICNVPEVIRGSETTDSGHFMLTEEEKKFLLKEYPNSKSFIKVFQGGGDIINNKFRWCLWLRDSQISDYKNISLVMEKIKLVKEFRSSSNKVRTRQWADFPTLFSEDRQPSTSFLAIPKVSSERRKYIPIAYLPETTIINNTVSALPNADLFSFGIITSFMHMIWMKYTCGRMKSDYIYSIQIVYNNYPWPENPSEKYIKTIEEAAQKVLDVRAEFPNSSLADLYDPLTMPPALVKAHQALDKAVDLAYRPQPFVSEAKRMEFLFDLYEKYTAGLFKTEKPKKTRKKQ